MTLLDHSGLYEILQYTPLFHFLSYAMKMANFFLDECFSAPLSYEYRCFFIKKC